VAACAHNQLITNSFSLFFHSICSSILQHKHHVCFHSIHLQTFDFHIFLTLPTLCHQDQVIRSPNVVSVHGHTNVKRLQSVQNSAARVVLKDNHHLSSGDLLSKLHWLPVQSRIEFKIACITYKVLTTGQPTYLSTLLNHYTPLCTLRSANQYRLQHPRVSTEFAKRSFSYLAPKIWNPSISGFALPYQPSNVISKRTYLNSILHFTPAILLT